MGLLIPMLFVTCPMTRDTDPTAPVSTPEVRAQRKVNQGLSPRTTVRGALGTPIPTASPSFLAPLPESQWGS